MCRFLLDLFKKPVIPPVTPPAIISAKDLCMIAYIWMDEAVVAAILKVMPKYLVANNIIQAAQSGIGIQRFKDAGIKYFEYIDGGYENINLMSIMADIHKAANAGAYGIFIDQVSYSPSGSQLAFLASIYQEAHTQGLKVVLNTGVANWSDSLMDCCDYINSTENWNGQNLSPSQTKWKERVWLLTEGCTLPNIASNLTLAAWSRGIASHYACELYTALPSWLDQYIANLEPDAPLTIPYPEEPPNYAQTSANTNVAMFIDKAMEERAVPEQYHLGWLISMDITIDNSFPYPAGVWETAGGLRHMKVQSPFVNAGICSHEVLAHGAWDRLTELQKLEWESVYGIMVQSDKLMVLLDIQNSYMNTSVVEAYAEVYRYLGQYMPEELKRFYPGLF